MILLIAFSNYIRFNIFDIYYYIDKIFINIAKLIFSNIIMINNVNFIYSSTFAIDSRSSGF